MASFKIDISEIRKYERDLLRFTKSAYPIAVRTMLNTTAFKARELSVKRFKKTLILRNKWTVNSLRIDKAQTNTLRLQVARMGSIQPYMVDQEKGATKRKKHKQGVRLATSFSSGEGDKARPRRKLQRIRTQKISMISKFKRKLKGKQRNLVAIKMALKHGKKFAYIQKGQRKSIVKLTGGKRNPKPKAYLDLSHKSVNIPRKPWLEPVNKRIVKLMPRLYRDALLYQMKRHGLG